jgi:hypothetical protein
MSATNTFENQLLALIFNGTAVPDLAENDSSTPQTTFYISLHTADPGEAGDQSTSETTYGSYARVPVTRDAGGWTVTGNQAVNVAEITFAQNTSGTPTITHVGLGKSASGAGTLLLSNPLATSLVMQVGTTPLFSAEELKFTVD